MKLYDIPRGSIINAETSSDEGVLGNQITFHHLDGMYSYCTVVGNDDKVVHLGATQALKKEKDGTYSLT